MLYKTAKVTSHTNVLWEKLWAFLSWFLTVEITWSNFGYVLSVRIYKFPSQSLDWTGLDLTDFIYPDLSLWYMQATTTQAISLSTRSWPNYIREIFAP